MRPLILGDGLLASEIINQTKPLTLSNDVFLNIIDRITLIDELEILEGNINLKEEYENKQPNEEIIKGLRLQQETKWLLLGIYDLKKISTQMNQQEHYL